MMIDLMLPAALAVIMFVMGLALTPEDFRRVAAHPRAVAVGLVCQVVLLPALAFATASLFRLRPEFAVGLVVLGACPGGITSNLLTHLAGGATALAVSLTAVTSVLATATLPLIVSIALARYGVVSASADLPVAGVTLGVFAVSTLPLLAGMAVRGWRPADTIRWEPRARRVATGLFAVIVVGAFASQGAVMMTYAAEVLPAALIVNAGSMAAATALALATGLARGERIAVVLETGMQNGAVGIFVALTLMGNLDVMVPSIVYALAMNLTALAFIALVRARHSGMA